MRVKVLSANLNGHARGTVVEMDDASAQTAIRERLAERTTDELTPAPDPATEQSAAAATEPARAEAAPRPAAKRAPRKRAAKKAGG